MRFNPEEIGFFASLTVTSTEFDAPRCQTSMIWHRGISNFVEVTVKLAKKIELKCRCIFSTG